MKTKVIALDIYGTVLDLEDRENILPPRQGFEEFIDRCKSMNLKVVTASDADLTMLKIDLDETFRNSRYKPKPNLEIFDRFYHMRDKPKDFSQVISDYKIKPAELLVIGDNPDVDISGAKLLGCLTLLVPPYNFRSINNAFNFSEIEIP